MKEVLKKSLMMIIVLSMVITVLPITTKAANYKVGDYKSYSKAKFGKTKYYSKENSDYTYNIIKSKKGKKTVLLKKVSSDFVTDGKTILYTKNKHKVYSYNIKTKKSKKLFSAKKNYYINVENAKGRYIYYHKYEEAYGSMYVFDKKTKTKKKLVTGMSHKVTVKNNKVYLQMFNGGDAGPSRYYVFTLSGKKLNSYIK